MEITAVRTEIARINRGIGRYESIKAKCQVRLYDLSRPWCPDTFDKWIKADRKQRALVESKRQLLADWQAWQQSRRDALLKAARKHEAFSTGWPVSYK